MIHFKRQIFDNDKNVRTSFKRFLLGDVSTDVA